MATKTVKNVNNEFNNAVVTLDGKKELLIPNNVVESEMETFKKDVQASIAFMSEEEYHIRYAKIKANKDRRTSEDDYIDGTLDFQVSIDEFYEEQFNELKANYMDVVQSVDEDYLLDELDGMQAIDPSQIKYNESITIAYVMTGITGRMQEDGKPKFYFGTFDLCDTIRANTIDFVQNDVDSLRDRASELKASIVDVVENNMSSDNDDCIVFKPHTIRISDACLKSIIAACYKGIKSNNKKSYTEQNFMKSTALSEQIFLHVLHFNYGLAKVKTTTTERTGNVFGIIK